MHPDGERILRPCAVNATCEAEQKENYMRVTFTTDAYADITMFGDVALTLLKMMGHSKTVPGAILAADVPMALNRLKAAINAENASPPVEKEVRMKVNG